MINSCTVRRSSLTSLSLFLPSFPFPRFHFFPPSFQFLTLFANFSLPPSLLLTCPGSSTQATCLLDSYCNTVRFVTNYTHFHLLLLKEKISSRLFLRPYLRQLPFPQEAQYRHFLQLGTRNLIASRRAGDHCRPVLLQ